MLLNLLTRILLVALVLLVVAEFIPGIEVESVYAAVIAALILGILNAVVRPVLIVLTLPVSIVTLGLFVFIINAGLFWFAASFIEGFTVIGFWPALLGSLTVTLVSAISNKFLTSTKTVADKT